MVKYHCRVIFWQQGNAILLEEGRYAETESLAEWCSVAGSFKFIHEDLANPELLLVSSTDFGGNYKYL